MWSQAKAKPRDLLMVLGGLMGGKQDFCWQLAVLATPLAPVIAPPLGTPDWGPSCVSSSLAQAGATSPEVLASPPLSNPGFLPPGIFIALLLRFDIR